MPLHRSKWEGADRGRVLALILTPEWSLLRETLAVIRSHHSRRLELAENWEETLKAQGALRLIDEIMRETNDMLAIEQEMLKLLREPTK